MANVVPILPPAQCQALLDAYDKAGAEKRRMAWFGVIILLLVVAIASVTAEVRPQMLAENIGRFTSYFGRIFRLENGASVFTDIGEWFWGLSKWSARLFDTMLIAYLGTLLGAIAAFVLCFSAAQNLTPAPLPRFLARRFLEFCRSVPEIVFALIFVVAFGLGPVPGVLALAIHTLGALGKLFSEVVENIDLKPVEGAIAAGGSRWQAIRYAVVPQVLSNFVSYALLRFEINVRGASVMGFVGAGGIGQDLIEAIRKFYYSDVSAILLMIVATVMVIDLVTERMRHALLEREQRA
jgi:phosphonate transport system permease protein